MEKKDPRQTKKPVSWVEGKGDAKETWHRVNQVLGSFAEGQLTGGGGRRKTNKRGKTLAGPRHNNSWGEEEGFFIITLRARSPTEGQRKRKKKHETYIESQELIAPQLVNSGGGLPNT